MGCASVTCSLLTNELAPLQVDLGLTKQIMDSPPGQEVRKRSIPMIGESGIFTPEHVQYVQDAGCQGILVGESIVRNGDFEEAVKALLARA
jgi:indole-3-glycerol phosphate synthase